MSLLGHAKEMRRFPTRSEGRLWRWLRHRRLAGVKFRRQQPMGYYVLDFYCAELRLAIEVDGEQHQEPWIIEYESHRSAFLRQLGIEVVRIPNELLIKDAVMVEEIIVAAIRERSR